VKDLKPIIAKNITTLRQNAKMTQSERAQRLNYSDKAVSKWERAESVPDVTVLQAIADLFGVNLEYLLAEDHAQTAEPEQQAPMAVKHRHSRPVIITLCVLLVWFLALLAYVVMDAIPPLIELQWLAFVYAVPVSMIVWLVLNSVWLNKKWNYLIISLLMWSVLAGVVITFLGFGMNIWKVLLLGIPGQIAIILWSRIRYKQPK
jgi:transcriptional regulator with XRE-family HTH domain